MQAQHAAGIAAAETLRLSGAKAFEAGFVVLKLAPKTSSAIARAGEPRSSPGATAVG